MINKLKKINRKKIAGDVACANLDVACANLDVAGANLDVARPESKTVDEAVEIEKAPEVAQVVQALVDAVTEEIEKSPEVAEIERASEALLEKLIDEVPLEQSEVVVDETEEVAEGRAMEILSALLCDDDFVERVIAANPKVRALVVDSYLRKLDSQKSARVISGATSRTTLYSPQKAKTLAEAKKIVESMLS